MNKDCPVDFVQVNENRVRLTALWVLLLVAVSFFAATLPVFIFLTVDFFLRAFNYGKLSPLNILSGIVVKQFNIGTKPIDQAPKRFAAGVGFVLAAAAVLFFIAGFSTCVVAVSVVFISFAFLESFVSFCAGCYVYTFLQRLKLIRP